jgi:hypothetical protein
VQISFMLQWKPEMTRFVVGVVIAAAVAAFCEDK